MKRRKLIKNIMRAMPRTQALPGRLFWLAALVMVVPPADAETMTFTATEDTTILNGSLVNNNYGNNNPIASGTVTSGITDQRSVLRFDVSALDGLYTSIDSITLRLFYADDSSLNAGTAVVTTDVHAISAANRAWVEGASTGAAQPGESTWNNLAHPSTSWAGSAGLGTADTDYDSTVLASSTIDLSNLPADETAFDFTFTGSSAALTALIDAWLVDNVDNSQANPGLLLRDPAPTVDNTRNRFTAHSTEDANAALHPQLIVEYSTTSPPPRVTITRPPEIRATTTLSGTAKRPRSMTCSVRRTFPPHPLVGRFTTPTAPAATIHTQTSLRTAVTGVSAVGPLRFLVVRERDASPK